MKQYFVDLKDLVHEKISFQDSFEAGGIDFAADNVRQVGPLDWAASAERAGAEIRIHGSLKTNMELMCSRCLEPARYEITKPFDLFFRQRDEQMFESYFLDFDPDQGLVAARNWEEQLLRKLRFCRLFLAIVTVVGLALWPVIPAAGLALILAGTGSMAAAALVLVARDTRKARPALIQGAAPGLAVLLTLITL